MEQKIGSSTDGVGRSGQLHAKKKKKRKLDHQLTPHTKINSRWIKRLKYKSHTIKFLQENIGRKISDIPYSNIFTDIFTRPRNVKKRINKWDLIN